MQRRSFFLGALALTAAVPAFGASMSAQISAPVPNRVFQQVAGKGAFRINWRGTIDEVRLKSGATVIATSSNGMFSNINPGWYDAVLAVGGVEGDSIKVGVGDVYLVAGQSTAVQPLQPSNFVYQRPSGPGKVIVSDYYGQGSHVFIDTYDTDATASIGWIKTGIDMNRAYPVMFVNVAKGNTSTLQWVQTHILEVFQGWAIYSPRAILWEQGPSDCTYPPATDSSTNMWAMVQSLREVTTTPWVVARESHTLPLPSGHTYWPIRDAQYYVINGWAHVHAGPDTDTLRNMGSGEDVEYWGSKLTDVGALWATTLAGLGL